MHYNDRRDVTMGGTYADCGGRGNHTPCYQSAETIFTLAVSGYTKGASGKPVYCGELHCQCVWTGVGGYTSGALSYNSDRLKKSLKKSRISTDLVLLKNAAFNQKVIVFRLDGADSKKN